MVLSCSHCPVHRDKSVEWGTGLFFTQTSKPCDREAKKPSRRFISFLLRRFKQPLEETGCVGIDSASGLQMQEEVTHLTTVCLSLIKRRHFSFTKRLFPYLPTQSHEPRNGPKGRSGKD